MSITPRLRKIMLTAQQLAEMWAISRSQVYKLTKRTHDPLPAYHLGGVRFKKEEADQWLERQKQPTGN